MLNLNALNDSVRLLVRTLLSLNNNYVRPANQNAPTGLTAVPFATVLVSQLERTGYDEFQYTNDASPATTVTEHIVGQRHFTASIQFFRGDAHTLASRLAALLQSSAAVEQLQLANLGVNKVGQAMNLTAVIDTNFEPRAQLQVEFYCISEEGLTLESIDTVPIQVDFEATTTNITVR